MKYQFTDGNPLEMTNKELKDVIRRARNTSRIRLNDTRREWHTMTLG